MGNLRAFSLVLISLTMAGCASYDPCPGPSYPYDPIEASTVREIDAIGKLDFDDARSTALEDIARRPNLSPYIQCRLAHQTVHILNFDDGKSRVLLAMIENPSFSYAGRNAILDVLDDITFDDTRSRLLKAMSEREPLVPPSSPVEPEDSTDDTAP